MRYYSYENFRDDMKILVGKLDETPDAIVAIARGGLTMGHFLGIALDIRNVFTINATLYFNKQKELLQISNIPSLEGHENVLVVDDIVDSGESMSKVCQILSAALCMRGDFLQRRGMHYARLCAAPHGGMD